MDKKFCDVCEKPIEGRYVNSKQDFRLMSSDNHVDANTNVSIDICILCAREQDIDQILPFKDDE